MAKKSFLFTLLFVALINSVWAFDFYEEKARDEEEKALDLAKERKVQEALLGIKEKYGKNAILKGLNFEEGATAKERNQQIGGHKA